MSVQTTRRTLEVTWPIEDTKASLADLKVEALDDLHETVHMHGYTAAGRPLVEVLHGVPGRIRALLDVNVPSTERTH